MRHEIEIPVLWGQMCTIPFSNNFADQDPIKPMHYFSPSTAYERARVPNQSCTLKRLSRCTQTAQMSGDTLKRKWSAHAQSNLYNSQLGLNSDTWQQT